jgi:hypothetical protein
MHVSYRNFRGNSSTSIKNKKINLFSKLGSMLSTSDATFYDPIYFYLHRHWTDSCETPARFLHVSHLGKWGTLILYSNCM